jgi:hypothetical protein
VSAVIQLNITRQAQRSQAIQILDRRLAARVLLLQSIIDFVALWVAPKGSFSDFALLSIGHDSFDKDTIDCV